MESANVFADLRGHAARLHATSLAALVAARLGRTRLIDNLAFDAAEAG